MARLAWTLMLLGVCHAASPVEATHDLQAQVAAARALIGEGKTPEALQKLAVILQGGKNDPEAMLAVGEIFRELAERRADQLQAAAPESAGAHALLGQSLEAQGKLAEALLEYRRALEKEPNTPGLHFMIGNVDWKLRTFEAAEAELAQELKVNPHHAMANLRMGEIVLDTRRDEPLQAVAFLQEAAAGAKSSPEVHRELGKALRLAHKFPEAVKELQLVEAQNPNDSSVHAQLAALYKDMGDSERARQEIEWHARLLRQKLEASQKAHSPPAQ